VLVGYYEEEEHQQGEHQQGDEGTVNRNPKVEAKDGLNTD
jgi:hypothetical protein